MSDVLAQCCAAGGGACEMEVSEVAMRITLDLIGMTGFGWVLLSWPSCAVVWSCQVWSCTVCSTRIVAQCGAEGLAMRAYHTAGCGCSWGEPHRTSSVLAPFRIAAAATPLQI